jgi:hypothetical protein
VISPDTHPLFISRAISSDLPHKFTKISNPKIKKEVRQPTRLKRTSFNLNPYYHEVTNIKKKGNTSFQKHSALQLPHPYEIKVKVISTPNPKYNLILT